MSKVQVIATRTGYDNVQVREEGDLFFVDEKLLNTTPKPTWFERAVPAPVAAPQFVPESKLTGDQGDVNDPKIGTDLEADLV